jgi:hypothetical protein
MTSRKRKLLPSARRHLFRLECKLAAIEAQIARLEKDPDLRLARQDHFILWKRPTFFVSWSSALLQ